MPNTDSRRADVPLNDLSIHICPTPQRAAAHRFAERCNQSGVIFGLRDVLDEAGLRPLPAVVQKPLDDSASTLQNIVAATDSQLTETRWSLALAIVRGPVTTCRIQ